MKRPGKKPKPDEFHPVPGIWRFHLAYLFVTLAMGWSFSPYNSTLTTSLLLVAGACFVGMLLAFWRQVRAAHMLALAIGLGTPVVVFAGLWFVHTILLFAALLSGIFVGRDDIF